MKVQIETPYGDTLTGTVRDNTDLDAEFILISDDDGKRYVVAGWTCYAEIL